MKSKQFCKSKVLTNQKRRKERHLNCGRILVPIDFSEHSKTTVSYAGKLASCYHATVHLLHVFEVPDAGAIPFDHRQGNRGRIMSQIDWPEQEAKENLKAFENQLVNAGVKVAAYVRVGDPFEEIVQMASLHSADLIVIGYHGHRGVIDLLVSSTAERVFERAPCPVLVVGSDH
jgi:nucleotide-binding universal stress UspA family protein